MYRWTVIAAALVLAVFMVVGCSGGNSPVAPNSNNNGDLTGSKNTQSVAVHKALWGYYDLYFDFEAGTIDADLNRTVQFNANVVQFLNGSGGIAFPDLTVDVQETYVGVDIDVAITHPLPDEAYNGYNVMGVFIGDGGGTLATDGRTYAVAGTDQSLSNADGYTRWFNPTEFTVPGVLGYTPGALATPSYNGDATINPYKLYGDALGTDDNAFDFVAADGTSNIFSASTTNTRNYLIQFPLPTPGVSYNYAVVASWAGELPENHPAPTTEAVACSVTVTDDIYYVDGTTNGGDLILDISLGGYGPQPSVLTVESSVISLPYVVPLIATGGGDTYSTYHCEVPADNVTSTGGNEFWVIAEYSASNYGNEFGVPNDAEDDALTSYFRNSLFVADEPYCSDVTVSDVDFGGGASDAPKGPVVGAILTGTGFDGLTGVVEFSGTSGTYIATNVASDGLTTITFDCDFTGAVSGELLDLYVENECGNNVTMDDYVTVAYDIVRYSGGAPGAGPVTLTPNEATSDNAIDIAVKPDDGAVYAFWTDAGNTNAPFLNRYAANGTTFQQSFNLFVVNPVGQVATYSNAFVDCSVGGWGAMTNPGWHWTGTHATMFSGTGYVNYPPQYPVDACNTGNNEVWSYHAFGLFIPTYYRTYMRRSTWVGNGSLFLTTAGAPNYDGAFSDYLVGMAMGSTDANFFTLTKDPAAANRVIRYNNSNWGSGIMSQFGPNGTGTGQISNKPIDITMNTTTNIIYVLDDPGTNLTRVQAFSMTGTFLGTSANIDASTFGGAAPYRLDYNQFENTIYVLYSNNKFDIFKDMVN